jgi:hypothetical protein
MISMFITVPLGKTHTLWRCTVASARILSGGNGMYKRVFQIPAVNSPSDLYG